MRPMTDGGNKTHFGRKMLVCAEGARVMTAPRVTAIRGDLRAGHLSALISLATHPILGETRKS